MSKLEYVKKVYGEHWDRVKNHVSDNGYIEYKIIGHGRSNGMDYDEDFNYKYEEVQVIQNYGFGQFLWRPIQLKGIEDNNGWIRIEDGILPNEKLEYEVVFNNIKIGWATYDGNNLWYTEYVDIKRTESHGITHFRYPIKHELPHY